MSKNWQPFIGLEIHVELKTASKMFCSCKAAHFGKKPNTQVCPVCLGLPGALPIANKKAIVWTVLTGLSLGCKISRFSKFDRKNYFYPDLPKGYQISQYDLPLCQDGKLGGVRIRRVHLEEDTAKMIHTKVTLLDFNRSGVPLMEIVTEPDIHLSSQAKEFLKKLTQVIRYLGISDCDMEKGTMRIEPNVSILKISNDEFLISNQLPNYKVEIKNINSFRFVEKAIDYEIKRQIQVYESDKTPVQETRGWDEKKQITYPQRVKEEAQDYRYFPEPDLPPIRWRDKDIKILRDSLPELPEKKLARFVKDYKLSEYNAKILTETRQTADYFEKAVKLGKDSLKPLEIANVIINKKVDIQKFSPIRLGKILFKKKTRVGIEEKELKRIVIQVLKNNPKAVADYQKGKITAIEFLIGQVISQAKGKADPNQTRKLLLEKLG